MTPKSFIAMQHLHVGDTKPEEKFCKAQNTSVYNKPKGGLWTSTFIDNKYGSPWIQYIYRNPQKLELPEDNAWESWIITPDPNTRVYVVDTLSDFMTMKKKYTGTGKFHLLEKIDFERMALDYDVIHITDNGISATGEIDKLYQWDCESSIWLNCSFTSNPLGRKNFIQMP